MGFGEVDEAELNFLLLHHLHSLVVTSEATEAFEREALSTGCFLGDTMRSEAVIRRRMRSAGSDTPMGAKPSAASDAALSETRHRADNSRREASPRSSAWVRARSSRLWLSISLARARLQVPLKLRSVDSTLIPIVRRRSRSHAPRFR